MVVSLLLVGLVSGTPIRHVIQVTPACLVAAFAWRGLTGSRAAALPIFLIWLFLMTLIWLYLLKIVAVIIGISAIGGIVFVFRRRDTARWTARLLGFLVSAILQIAALWLSFQPAFARR